MKTRMSKLTAVILSLVTAVTIAPKSPEKKEVQAATDKCYDGTVTSYSITPTYNEGWYFAPVAEGKYPGLILVHGSGSPDYLRYNMPSLMNKWVELGYVDPMVVFIPHIYMLKETQWGITDFGEYVSLNYCRSLANKMLDGSICNKVDSSKKLSIGGYSMGGSTALYAGVHDSDIFVNVGGLSPSWCFYSGENGAGWMKHGSDLIFSQRDDAHCLISYGKGEPVEFGQNATLDYNTITGNGKNRNEHFKFFEFDKSVGAHDVNVFKREIFMFLYYTKYNELPDMSIVEAACGNGAVPTPTKIPTPDTPTNVKAVATSTSHISVSWDKVGGASGYQVWRGTSATGSFTALGSYTDTSKVSIGLKDGTTYYYKVRAYTLLNGKKVFGDFSKVVSATTYAKPAVPSNVKAAPSSKTHITVSWNKVNGATGYQVWRGTSASGPFTALGSYTETSKVSIGLTPGKTYYYKVRAYKMIDGKKVFGDYSKVVSATTYSK